jgi:hypothetical protein
MRGAEHEGDVEAFRRNRFFHNMPLKYVFFRVTLLFRPLVVGFYVLGPQLTSTNEHESGTPVF